MTASETAAITRGIELGSSPIRSAASPSAGSVAASAIGYTEVAHLGSARGKIHGSIPALGRVVVNR